MNTLQIVSLILSSSITSAVITAFVSWLIQKDNYKREYYKKILDKRLKVYTDIEKIITQLNVMAHYEGTNKLIPFFCSQGDEIFAEFIGKFGLVTGNSFWLSDELSDKMQKFNIYLLRMSYKVIEAQNIDSQIEDLGFQNRDEIKKYRDEVRVLMLRDLFELHNIKKFIKNKDSTGVDNIV
jgi:hypothetical protein